MSFVQIAKENYPWSTLCLIGLLGILFWHFYINGQIIKTLKKHGLDLPKTVLFGESPIFCFKNACFLPTAFFLVGAHPWLSQMRRCWGALELRVELSSHWPFPVSFLGLCLKWVLGFHQKMPKYPLWMESEISLSQRWLDAVYQIVHAVLFSKVSNLKTRSFVFWNP